MRDANIPLTSEIRIRQRWPWDEKEKMRHLPGRLYKPRISNISHTNLRNHYYRAKKPVCNLNRSRKMNSFGRYTFSLAVVLYISVVLCAENSEAATAKRPFRGQGGWTLNSVGYNAGLGALRKLFEKRDGSSLDVQSMPLDNDEMENLAKDFALFLEVKESGLLGPRMLRCILSRNDQMDSMSDM
ncbi:galanin-like peptide [Ciona intestinalis]